MLFRAPESHPRSLLKAISWRILGSIDTFVLSLLFTHKPFLAASIAGTETITKILLYYFHERAWAAVPWGHRRAAVEPERPEAAPAPAPAPTSAPALSTVRLAE